MPPVSAASAHPFAYMSTQQNGAPQSADTAMKLQMPSSAAHPSYKKGNKLLTHREQQPDPHREQQRASRCTARPARQNACRTMSVHAKGDWTEARRRRRAGVSPDLFSPCRRSRAVPAASSRDACLRAHTRQCLRNHSIRTPATRPPSQMSTRVLLCRYKMETEKLHVRHVLLWSPSHSRLPRGG